MSWLCTGSYTRFPRSIRPSKIILKYLKCAPRCVCRPHTCFMSIQVLIGIRSKVRIHTHKKSIEPTLIWKHILSGGRIVRAGWERKIFGRVLYHRRGKSFRWIYVMGFTGELKIFANKVSSYSFFFLLICVSISDQKFVSSFCLLNFDLFFGMNTSGTCV